MDLPEPGIKPGSPTLQAYSLPTELSGKPYDQPRQHIKKQRCHFANKGLHSQSYGLSSSHTRMWELDNKECWVPKNSWSWIMVLKKIFESPMNNKEIKAVNPKGNQPWIFTGSTDAKAEAPILWLPDAKSWEKTLMLGKNEGKRRWKHQRMRRLASPTQWTWIWANSRR